MNAKLRDDALQSAFLLRGRKSCSNAWNGWAESLNVPSRHLHRHRCWN